MINEARLRGLRRLRREVQLHVGAPGRDTELGRKTQIHQASCNKDYSCLEGDCPSFVTVVPGKRPARDGAASRPSADCPSPSCGCARDCDVVMTGIGGTGVVTVNQVLGTAALLDGRHVRGLDQTGLSRRAAPWSPT